MILATKIFSWILLIFLIAGGGVYIYLDTSVEGSLTGLNPLGMLILLASGITTCILFWVGLRHFLPQILKLSTRK